jgi:hypothetical protein
VSGVAAGGSGVAGTLHPSALHRADATRCGAGRGHGFVHGFVHASRLTPRASRLAPHASRMWPASSGLRLLLYCIALGMLCNLPVYCVQEMDRVRRDALVREICTRQTPNSASDSGSSGSSPTRRMHATRPTLASATTVAARLQVDRDSLGEVRVEVAHFLLREGLPRNDFERLLYVDSLFCARLKIGNAALGLAVRHGTLLRDLQHG